MTTLDVLSGGRAYLGIGAAWFEREHLGLGIPFPPLRERFERLEDALQICLQMWSDNDGPFEGKRTNLAETLNSPQSLSRPHPPILIGGGGEKKTLRLVAKYADACNIFATTPPEVAHKFDVIREYCEREGRDYAAIEKTIIMRMDVGANGEKADELVETLGRFAEVGAQTALGYLQGVDNIRPIEAVGRDVIPQIAALLPVPVARLIVPDREGAAPALDPAPLVSGRRIHTSSQLDRNPHDPARARSTHPHEAPARSPHRYAGARRVRSGCTACPARPLAAAAVYRCRVGRCCDRLRNGRSGGRLASPNPSPLPLSAT